ncbi:hypothetical protein BJY00DRAFT_103445 [Aspergillus carlsbadensis]|nr:hypothetical protein BJY00DRAFT_103445 [Aspergillus carlsbadensis]
MRFDRGVNYVTETKFLAAPPRRFCAISLRLVSAVIGLVAPLLHAAALFCPLIDACHNPSLGSGALRKKKKNNEGNFGPFFVSHRHDCVQLSCIGSDHVNHPRDIFRTFTVKVLE